MGVLDNKQSLADFIAAARAAHKTDDEIRTYVAQRAQAEGAGFPNVRHGQGPPFEDYRSQYQRAIEGNLGADISSQPFTDLTGTKTFSGRNIAGMSDAEQAASAVLGGASRAALTGATYYAGAEGGAMLGSALLSKYPIVGGALGSAAGQAATDIGFDIAEGNRPSPLKSAVIGGLGATGQAALEGAGKGFARAAGVSKRTVQNTLQQSTAGRAAQMFGGITEGEDVMLARQAAQETGQALSKQNLSPGRIAANRKIREFDVANRLAAGEPAGHPLSAEEFHRNYSTVARTGPPPLVGEEFGGQPAHVASAAFERQYPNAKQIRKAAVKQALESGEGVPRSVVSDFPDLLANAEAGVDMTPVKEKVRSLIRPNSANDQVLATNAQLAALDKRIPDQMSMHEYDQFIREHSGQVKQAMGNIESPLPTEVRKDIAKFSVGYRNRVLPLAKADFTRAQNYIVNIKNLRQRLVNSKGELKNNAEDIFKKSLNKFRVLEAFRKYDAETGGDLTQRTLQLAYRQDWTPADGKEALGGLEALVGWLGRAVLYAGRGLGKTAILASRPVGGLLGGTASGAYGVAQQQQASQQAFLDAMKARNNP